MKNYEIFSRQEQVCAGRTGRKVRFRPIATPSSGSWRWKAAEHRELRTGKVAVPTPPAPQHPPAQGGHGIAPAPQGRALLLRQPLGTPTAAKTSSTPGPPRPQFLWLRINFEGVTAKRWHCDPRTEARSLLLIKMQHPSACAPPNPKPQIHGLAPRTSGCVVGQRKSSTKRSDSHEKKKKMDETLK